MMNTERSGYRSRRERPVQDRRKGRYIAGARRVRALRPAGIALACAIALSSCGGPSLSSIESRLSHLHSLRSATHAQLACAAKVFRRDISASNLERWVQGKVSTDKVTAHHHGIGLSVMASCAGKKG